jgi:PAS domain S-box-containing protein
MKPGTALALVFIGIALAIHPRRGMRSRRRPWAVGLATAAALIGVDALVEAAFDVNPSIHGLLANFTHLRLSPERMSIATGASLTAIGSAVALLDVRFGPSARSPSQWLACATLLCSLLPLLGYLYGVHVLTRTGPFASMALPTALAHLLGGAAVLCARPEVGIMRVVTSASPAGVTARRLLPAAFLAPFLIGWLRLKGQQAGYYGTEFGLAINVFSNIVLFAWLVASSGMRLLRSDAARTEIERELRESEARSAAVVAGALDCIVTMDDAGRVTDFNPAAEKTFGYARANAVNRPLAELIVPPGLREAHRAGLALYLRTGEGPLLEKRIEIGAMRADGTEFPVELIIVPTRIGGRRSFTGFLRDLTERKEAEAAVEKIRAQREADLRASVQARDDFIHVAGHELKTPVATFVMQVQNLERTVKSGGAQGKISEGIQKAQRSARHLDRLILRLLDVSRITSGRLCLEPEPVELTEVVHDVVARFAEGQPRSAIQLRSDAHVAGHWDRLRIEQVIDNLVANAVKYGQGKPVEVDLHAEAGAAVLRVVDHGIGIEEEHQQKLFQRFERAKSARNFDGMGLGLWISRQIVDASGGEIGVESRPGEGSSFTVRLPLGEPAARP